MGKIETKKVTLEELLCLDLKGKIICFPTDTVYGVGALVDDSEALNKIYEMKKRDTTKPLALLCGNTNQIIPYILTISPKALELMKKHWPGALTIIFKKTDRLSREITKEKDTVAFRMPNNQIALKILNTFGIMATTSVNLSGKKELNTVNEILNEFDGIIDYIVTDEAICEKVPSTIYDDTTGVILRQGTVKIEF